MVWKVIQELFGNNVNRDARLYVDCALEPMDMWNLSVLMEERLGVCRENVNLKGCKTLADVERVYKEVLQPKIKSSSAPQKNSVWSVIQEFFGKNVNRDERLYVEHAMTPLGLWNLSVLMEERLGICKENVNLHECKTLGDVERVYDAVLQPKANGRSLLYTNICGVPHCALTEKKCYTALNAKRDGDEDICLRANCNIAKNFYKLVQKVR